MKIYAICVLKNEEDIIEYTLSKALDWADKIIVYDNGSTDDTWQIIKSMGNSKIIPFLQDSKPYSDGLRATIFQAFKSEMKNGDWWVIQDADEVFMDNPRWFIESQQGNFHHINGKKIDFCFDLNHIENIDFHKDFSNNLGLFRFYTPEAWSEPRVIKHRRGLIWKEKDIWPVHLGLVCKNSINIKHFPLRSIEQIKNRWNTRCKVKDQGGQSFKHWEKEDWKDYYSWKTDNLREAKDEKAVFETVDFANSFKQSYPKRILKTILHASGIWK